MEMSRQLRTAIVILTLATFALLLGCEDPPPPPAPPPPKMEPLPTKPAVTTEEAAKQAEMALTEKDFLERVDNRDPFRSFIAMFQATKTRYVGSQVKVKMRRYALDELKLIAVIAGPTVRPIAMFRDPAGLGVTVKRGDYISKSMGKIKQILNDKVIVTIEQSMDDTSSKSDRVIDLYEKAKM